MKKILFSLFAAAMLLTSCNIEVKYQAIGKPYEILVLCDDDIWSDSAGHVVYDILTQDIIGLPQPEGSFKVTRMRTATQEASKHRNILILDAEKGKYEKCELRYERDMISEDQFVVSITAPSKEELKEYVENNSDMLVEVFNGAEMERKLTEYRLSHNREAEKMVMDKFGCEIVIPSSLTDYKEGKNFIWISDYFSNRPEIMNLVIYSYPYTSPENFSFDNFIMTRDSIMKEHIHGSGIEQYIQTDGRFVTIEEKSFRDRYLQEARGLWFMTNIAMGGPFVSYSTVDEVNERVIVAEIFVYAPHKEKRQLVRDMEALLTTLKLPADLIIENSSAMEEIVVEGKNE